MSGTTVSENSKGTSGCSNFIFIPPPKGTNLVQKNIELQGKVADLDNTINELQGKVDYIIDGGESDIGLESTVVRVIDNEIKILRPGKITKEDIEKDINYKEHIKNVVKNKKIDMNFKKILPHIIAVVAFIVVSFVFFSPVIYTNRYEK